MSGQHAVYFSMRALSDSFVTERSKKEYGTAEEEEGQKMRRRKKGKKRGQKLQFRK